MTNFDRLADAVPHYYGDNFPNSETTDFDYLKTLRQLDGTVIFEFHGLPPWAKQEWQDRNGQIHAGVADPEAFAQAVIRFCQLAQQRSGAPPDIIGIQNEKPQPSEIWYGMTLVLRRELDRAGFDAVRIYMSDAGALKTGRQEPLGIERAKLFRRAPVVWDTIDYAATHMYDYQYNNFFSEPDGYDAWLHEWREAIGDKPFLSTELCINHVPFQSDSFRLALLMGQLYHKNLSVTDAVAVCYCRLLLNTVQPSFGWTRTLMVPDKSHGFIPTASSHQLRVFGAYSRRIHRGMVRIEARSSSSDLLVTAFAGSDDARTVVLLNRACAAQDVAIEGFRKGFRYMEIVDPYHENEIIRAPMPDADNTTHVAIDPGAIITLSTVALKKLPPDFVLDAD
jgi:hypothetical protein